MAGCVVLEGLGSAGPPVRKTAHSTGAWPMARGGLLRANRAEIKGKIKTAPKIAWRYKVGSEAPSVISADLDEDGSVETYSVENGCIVKRDSQGKRLWRSPHIGRTMTLVGFEDLDGDGRREPLMVGTGLNSAKPLYFIFDPKNGAIRWRVELNATNGGDYRFGKIDPSRKGVQLLRSLFPNPGGGEMHLFCWDRGIEEGYTAWSWQRHDDFIYFPQLAVGDVNGDGRNEALMLSQMCVWMFDTTTGTELGRVFWGKRTRSYGGQFGLWRMRPGPTPSILVASAYNKISVIDYLEGKLKLRWDHEFEPGVGDTDLKGQLQFLQDGICDLDGDGWTEVVCNEWSGQTDGKWRVVVLSARDGKVLFERVGSVMVDAADIDGDGRAEVFLRDRGDRHDAISGRVSVARWIPGQGLEIAWTAPIEGGLVREPNATDLTLSRHPDEGDRVKLADGSAPGQRAFFVRSTDGATKAFEATPTGIRASTVAAPPDRFQPLKGLTATQSVPPEAPLAVDFDGDGWNETIQRMTDGRWAVIKPPRGRRKMPSLIATLPPIIDTPLFADIDGDGRVEVIAVRMSDAAGPIKRQQPCVEVTRADGRLVWRRAWEADFAGKFTLDKGGFAVMFVSVGHFTGGNPLDVVVSYSGERTGGHTAVLDGATGETVWDIDKLYPGMYGECWDRHPPPVFDHDGDGLDDIATVCQTVHYTILRGRDGKQLIQKPWDVSGQSFGGEKSLFPGGWAVGAMLAAIRQKGEEGLAIGVLHSQAAIGAIRPTGEQRWFKNLLVTERPPTPGCWADVDGDRQPEACFICADGYVRVYDGATGQLRWEERMDSQGRLMAADIDGDGADELLFSSERGQLCCLANRTASANGSHLRWALEFEGAPGQAIFADVNGDGLGEVLVPTSDGYLACLGH